MVFETVRSVLFYLDTRQRSGGTIGAPEFTFPNNLINVKPQNGEKLRLTMQEASIEYTFFQTEEFNNKFVVREWVGAGTDFPVDAPDAPPIVTRIIKIPIGNYNLNTFIVELTNSLNSYDTDQFSTGSPQLALYRWSLTYIPETNRFTYTAIPRNAADSPGGAYFIYDQLLGAEFFPDIDDFIFESLNEMMGFFDDDVILLEPNTLGTALFCTSKIPVTMSPGVENLYVTIRNSCSNFGNANERNTFSASNILAKIPVSNPPFSTLYFYDLNANFSTIIENRYLDNVSLTLFNEQFTQIEPRKDWTFTVKIDVVRPRTELDSSRALKELLDIERMKMIRNDKAPPKKPKVIPMPPPTATKPTKPRGNKKAQKTTQKKVSSK